MRHRRRVRALPRLRSRPHRHAREPGRGGAGQRAVVAGPRGEGRAAHRGIERVQGGDRAARERARDHQQHPGGHGGRARLPGDRRPRRRQAARGVQYRDIGIRWYDAKANWSITCTHYEHGARLRHRAADHRHRAASGQDDGRTRRPLVLNNRRRVRRRGDTSIPGTDQSLSSMPYPSSAATASLAPSPWKTTSARTPTARPRCGC